MRMAEDIREGKPVSPERYGRQTPQLLGVIQKASDTGIRQTF
jgi:hypothetical protein